MIFELANDSFHKVYSLVGTFSHYLVLRVLLDGKTPARIWVDHPENPTTALVWDMLNTLFFFLGDSKNIELNQRLNRLIQDTILPETRQRQYRKLFLQFQPHNTWKEQLGVILKGINYDQRFIYSYVLDPHHANHIRNRITELPNGFQLVRINAELMDRPNLKNLDRITADIRACWQSTDRYINNDGIGYCILRDDEITAWCSTDFITENECELYIETFEEYQRAGLGTQVGFACVQSCIDRGLTVRWHCFDYAFGSIKIAEKINFMKEEECPVHIVDLSNHKKQTES